MRKIRASTKIFLGFIGTVAILWLAYNKIQDLMIMGQKFPPISPKHINIVGITPNGYKVIVSNQVAQLVETQGGFAADQSDNDDSSTDGSVKKKISVKDMLGTLSGDSRALSSFVMSMNDINENDLPPIRVLWDKGSIQKALQGDPVQLAKLERDLNMKLDGTPLSKLNVNSIQNGIVLEIPVTVGVNVDGKPQNVTGNVLLAYKPRLARMVEADVARDAGKIDETVIAGYYKEEAEKVLAKPASRENIRQYLTDALSDESARRYVDYPERILRTAFVVVNDNLVDGASYTTAISPSGKPIYTLHITLNDEGRRRLWQYSRQRVGDQILLTSNGVAIAAARIQHSLMGSDIAITNMNDQGLLDDLIATLKSVKANGKMASR